MSRKMPRFGQGASHLRQAIAPLSIWWIKLERDPLRINFTISTQKIAANVSFYLFYTFIVLFIEAAIGSLLLGGIKKAQNVD